MILSKSDGLCTVLSMGDLCSDDLGNFQAYAGEWTFELHASRTHAHSITVHTAVVPKEGDDPRK